MSTDPIDRLLVIAGIAVVFSVMNPNPIDWLMIIAGVAVVIAVIIDAARR
jgi:predicted ABC-type sugar transport system permease subunit